MFTGSLENAWDAALPLNLSSIILKKSKSSIVCPSSSGTIAPPPVKHAVYDSMVTAGSPLSHFNAAFVFSHLGIQYRAHGSGLPELSRRAAHVPKVLANEPSSVFGSNIPI
jgi:hypothetical protein